METEILEGRSAPPGAPVITGVELTPLFVPFRESVKEAMSSGEGSLGMAIPAEEEWNGGDFVVCRVVAEDGSAGLGEAFVWLPETGATPGQIIDVVERALAGYLLGESPFDVERICARMDRNVARNEVAKGMLDMACYDLMGRITGSPACALFGGTSVKDIPLAALLPLMEPSTMAWLAEGYVEGGFRTVRVKLGTGVRDDAFIMERVREVVGEAVRLRVDYNQAYGPAEAVRAIKAIEPVGIDVAEQPVAAGDYPGMAWVQERVDTPLMCHEGCFSLWDIATLVELGAVGVVGVNPARPGGVTGAMRAISLAEGRGMGVVLHDQPLGIGAAMMLHLAAARYDALGHDPELFGDVMLEDDLILEPVLYEDGTATVPSGPGWGVELDVDALERYAAGPTVSIK